MIQEKIATIQTLRNSVSTIAKDIAKPGISYKILKNRRPVGIFLNYQDYQSLLDNLVELSDTELVSSVQEARQEFGRGEGKLLEKVI
ncbi:MAG: hypothetical protein ABH896_03185 [Candidatus Jacksonbacteria bacterium]